MSDTVFSLCEAIFSTISIGLIPENWMPDVSHMDTDLMGPSCLDPTFYERVFITDYFTEDSIVCGSFLSFFVHAYLCFTSCFFDSEELRSDRVSRFLWGADDESVIDFFYLMRLEEVEERLEGFFILGDHDTSTGVSIDPVDERRLEGERIVLLTEIILSKFDERYFFCLVISWVDVYS